MELQNDVLGIQNDAVELQNDDPGIPNDASRSKTAPESILGGGVQEGGKKTQFPKWSQNRKNRSKASLVKSVFRVHETPLFT